MLALLVVAAALGLSNFAAALGIGVAGVDAATRLRVGLVFGAFEAGMPVVGLLIGQHLAGSLGHAARWVSGGLLIAVGGYALLSAVRSPARTPARTPSAQATGHPSSAPRFWRLLLTGLALSLDNLVVGFALGAYNVSILAGALIIGAVSAALSLIGLELGARLGRWAGERGEQLAGLLLVGVGIAIAAGVLT